MTTSPKATSDYLSQHQALSQQLPGNHLPWLKAIRQTALEQFAEHGFPSPREEEWRYTNVTPIERTLFEPIQNSLNLPNIDPAWLTRYTLPDCDIMVFVDGWYASTLSSLSEPFNGTVIGSLSEVLEQQPDMVETAFNRSLTDETSGFIAFNSAWFSDGAVIHLAKNSTLERPIQLLHVATQPQARSVYRHLITAGSGATGSIIETYVGIEGANHLTTAVCEVTVGDNAQLDLTKLQFENDQSYHFGGSYANLADYGRLNHQSYSFGGLLARNELHVRLGRAAECQLNGLFLAANRQHVDNHTRIDHLEPHGISREQYKGILDDRAQGVFQGRIVVHKDAQKTDSAMNNRNLLLSANAEIDTKPQLEIHADDVKCAHGVTVGELAEESLFFLRSRGIDEASARNMLLFAFANEIVEQSSFEPLRHLILDQMLNCLPQADIEKEWL